MIVMTVRQIEQPAGDQRRRQQRQRADRRDLEAPQDAASRSITARIPAPNKPLPSTPITAPSSRPWWPRRGALGVEHAAEGEEEDQREQVVEEDDRPVAKREPQVVADEREIAASFAQALAGQLDEDVFERRPLELHVDEFEALLVHPLHQLDQRARRMMRRHDERLAIGRDLHMVRFGQRGRRGPRRAAAMTRISMRLVPTVRACTSAGVPIAMMRPSSMIATRSQSRSASSM